MIKKYSLKALEAAMNHALALDETTASKIAALHGKVVELVISPLDVHFYICFKQQKLELLPEFMEKADTIIESSPLGLIRLSFLPASKARSLFNDKIRLSGDVALGQSVKKLFDELNIDWEGHLANFTGDVIAYQIGSLLRQGRAFQKKLGESMRYNLRDYLQEELQIFPPREETSDFFTDVDQLSLDVERLQAHINHLIADYEIN